MRQQPWTAGLTVAAAVLGWAAAAFGQVEPWRSPTPAPPPPAHATSTVGATAPTASEQRDARRLATAVFARPAAAQRAADKAAKAMEPVLPPPEPKPEWRASDGPRLGGKGMEIKTPF